MMANSRSEVKAGYAALAEETVLENDNCTYLSFEQLASRHGLQLFQGHVICDLNASHFLHHFFQDQQVETAVRRRDINQNADPFK